jgi:nucleoside-diphosphate-sugar epimerase
MLTHLNAAPQKPKRVAVIGAQGFVGDAIAARLERDGVGVLRIARREADLLAPDAVQRLCDLLRPGDAIVAAAALAPCRNPAMLRDNMSLALAIVEAAAAAAPSHVVNISSDAVYADSAEPLTERSIAAPDTLHGVMHLAREAMFRASVTAPLATLRPSLLYGAGDPHNGYGPNRFRRLAKKGEAIVLFGEGEERRDHVLIDDLAELAARALYRRSAGVLNVATGHVSSFCDIARMVAGAAGVAVRGSPRSTPMPHNGYRPFDAVACRAAFPDFAYTPLAEGLAKAWREDDA